MKLTISEKKKLLSLARSSIAASLGIQPVSDVRELAGSVYETPSGAFVTLHMHGELRGCIGYIEALLPLSTTIREAAEKAALEDPRFPSLSAAEFKDVVIEISVLSPLKKIAGIDEIEIGVHGLVVETRYARGLLLPQVATEYGWGKAQFASHTCRKAGLPPDAWKSHEVSLSTFTTDIFSEDEHLNVSV